MKRPLIDLSLKTVSTKVSVDAWNRAQELKEKFDVRLSDVISVCLLYMPEDDLGRILAENAAVIDALPKSVKGLMRNLDKLSDEEKDWLREMLS